MRWIGCLVVALLPPVPSYAAPPLTIRVPHVAQADAVPPAVVVAAAGEELAGTPYVVGALPGGPTRLRTINDNRCDTCEPIVAGPFDTPALTYQDDPDDWVMNEIGISYNAPAVLLLALLQPD
jgi:hypothetical protein